MKQQTHVACFSETVKSVKMWSHYAKRHTGFALEYDFRHSFTDCERCEDKASCPNRVLTKGDNHYLFRMISMPLIELAASDCMIDEEDFLKAVF